MDRTADPRGLPTGLHRLGRPPWSESERGDAVELGALGLILAAIFAWGTFSARAEAISTPIFFVAIGVAMATSQKLIGLDLDPHLIKVIAEVTLVWVLFADASRVRVTDLRADEEGYTCACWPWACH